MHDSRAFGLNPLAYVRGLARAAAQAGATIHPFSRVLSLTPEGSGWSLRTAAGKLKAKQVVIATDAYTDDLWPGLLRTIIPIRAYQIVSEPIEASLTSTILPHGHLLTDTRRLYGGVRLTPDFRLQLSVDGPPFQLDGKAMRHKATARVLSLYPQLNGVQWVQEWSGWVGMTRDHVPHVHRLAANVWAALGFNGRGIAMATSMGRDMARRLCGWDDRDLAFLETQPHPFPPRLLTQPAVSTLIRRHRLQDAMDLRKQTR